jgi:hypothetical protein
MLNTTRQHQFCDRGKLHYSSSHPDMKNTEGCTLALLPMYAGAVPVPNWHFLTRQRFQTKPYTYSNESQEAAMKKMHFALLALLTMLMLGYAESTAQQKNGKIYWMSTVTIPLGKMPEYHVFAERELIPAQEKAGYRYVAGWQTIVGEIEEAVVVAEFDNMDAYQNARATLMASPEWKVVSANLDGLSRGVRTRMLSALPYIKMK